MTTNTDGIPAPEARVRAYVDTVDMGEDELDWNITDDGPVYLNASDIRDVLNELRAARETLESVWGVITGGGNTTAMVATIAKLMEGN